MATLQSASLDEETDIIIIGSGITGCSIARNLLQNNKSLQIVVLEARSISSGATGRNGGHVKAVPEYSYAELNDSLGKEAADEVIRFTLANVDALMDVTSQLSPELQRFCEMRRVEALNLFTDEEAYAEFKELLGEYERDHAKRGYLVEREELESVSVLILIIEGLLLILVRRNLMSTTLLVRILLLLGQGGRIDLSQGYSRKCYSNTKVV